MLRMPSSGVSLFPQRVSMIVRCYESDLVCGDSAYTGFHFDEFLKTAWVKSRNHEKRIRNCPQSEEAKARNGLLQRAMPKLSMFLADEKTIKENTLDCLGSAKQSLGCDFATLRSSISSLFKRNNSRASLLIQVSRPC